MQNQTHATTTSMDQEDTWHMGEDARNVMDQLVSQMWQAAAELAQR